MLMRRRPSWLRATWLWLYVRARMMILLAVERGEVAQSVHPGQEEVRSACERGKGRNALVHLADRSFGDGEIQRAVLGAADRVVLVAEFVEGLVVDPDVLGEFELANQV